MPTSPTRTHVALLRGINVGGRNKVAMADLRDIATSIGLADPATYIQSGNLVFRSDGPDTSGAAGEARLASLLATALESAIGVAAPVVVVERARLERIAHANPFAAEKDPKKVHVLFQQSPPGADRVEAITKLEVNAAAKGSQDRAVVVEGVALYLHTPAGLGRSDLAALLSRSPQAAKDATARNWATVIKLQQLLAV